MAVSRTETGRSINPDLGMTEVQYTRVMIVFGLASGLIAGVILSQLHTEMQQPAGINSIPTEPQTK